MLLKINNILLKAETKRAHNPSTTLELTTQAIRLARLNSAKFSGELIQALLIRGKILAELCDYTEALSAATEAMALAEAHQNTQAIKSILVVMATTYCHQGFYEETLSCLHKAIALHDNHSSDPIDLEWQAKILNNLGFSYGLMQNPEQGLPYLQNSLKILRTLSNQEMLANTLDSLGDAYLLLGDTINALPYALESYRVASDNNYLSVTALAAVHVAKIYLQNNQIELARQYGQTALSISADNQFLKIQAQTLHLLADLEKQQAEHEASVNYLHRTLALVKKIDHKYHIAAVLHDLALHYKQHGLFEQALRYTEMHHEALNQFHEQKNTWRVRNLEIMHDIDQIKRDHELVKQKNYSLRHEVRHKQLQHYSDQLESEVSLRNAELEASNLQLKTALYNIQQTRIELAQAERMNAMGSMAVGIAHELSTPLGNGIMVASTIADQTRQLVERMQDNQMRRSDLLQYLNQSAQSTGMLMKSLNNAVRLVNNFKQIALTRESEDRRSFFLCQLSKEITETEITLDNGHAFPIVWDIPDDLTMVSYPRAIVQVFAILIENAGLHAFEGQPQDRLHIQARLQGSQVVLQICDNGVGIREEVLPHIFEPFYTTKLGKGGSGLGLCIIFNLVNNILGGEIDVQSQPRKGCCVHITVPQVTD